MKAVEFKTKIRNNSILIPNKMLPELLVEQNKNVRVIVFVEDTDVYDEKAYRKITKEQFLKGYADTDSVYDY